MLTSTQHSNVNAIVYMGSTAEMLFRKCQMYFSIERVLLGKSW